MPKERFHSRDELSSRDASEEKEVLTEDFKVRDFIQGDSWRERHGKPPINMANHIDNRTRSVTGVLAKREGAHRG